MIKRYLAKRDNPWELLVLALCCILPGAALMFHKGLLMLDSRGRSLTYHAVFPQSAARAFGAIAIVLGLLLVCLYVYVLRSADPEKTDVKPRPFLRAE